MLWLLLPGKTGNTESFPLISVHRCGSLGVQFHAQYLDQPWKSGWKDMWALAICELKGSWPRGPLNRKAEFLFSLIRGPKCCRIWKTQSSLSSRCPDCFQRPWSTGFYWLASTPTASFSCQPVLWGQWLEHCSHALLSEKRGQFSIYAWISDEFHYSLKFILLHS